eukprot:TRINITY_DN111764_c0_g1_i1.p1 TRINITY_DN111764_c0_g1~~TRINITY_DN111764_c0_g1_i1.p1  ORF type:complete len:467 (+),score=105.30 TRINITY_DN111764_c0_g1_i1:119-1519(+)
MLQGIGNLMRKPSAALAEGKNWTTEKSEAMRLPMASYLGGMGRKPTHADLTPVSDEVPSLGIVRAKWEKYRSSNPRLRDPRQLARLTKQGVPEELREEIWSFCLGLDARNDAADDGTGSACGSTAAPSDAQHAHSAQSAEDELQDEDESVALDAELDEALDEDAAPLQDDAAFYSARPIEDAGYPLPAEAPTVAPPKTLPAEDVLLSRQVTLVTMDDELPSGAAAMIETDVTRTFLSCTEFMEKGGQDRLRRVLRALAAADPGLGYCQSLNFVGAILLMVFDDERIAFLALQQIILKLGIRAWYMDGMRQLRADVAVLEDIVRERLPSVYNSFRNAKLEFTMVCSRWFLALFGTTLEGETLRRVWDVIVCDGIEAVMRIAFALIWAHRQEAEKAQSIDELIELFQGKQTKLSTASLLKTAYSSRLIGRLNKAELAQRRQRAAARVTTSDLGEACHWRGGVVRWKNE